MYFKKDFRYVSFAELKTDACNKCTAFKASGKSNNKEHLEHLDEANLVYQMKREDKIRAKEDPSFLLISFDLEKCLPTPNLTCSEAFYKRLLWTYNLTIFDYTPNSEAVCYMWSEDTGKKGSNEIASCLYDFLQNALKKNPQIQEVKLYSDSCAGQNKNRQVIGMEKFILETLFQIKQISHTYMVPGHTHMECDTIHALVEKVKKRVQVFTPTDWYTVVSTCKSSRPFVKVIPLTQKMIFRWDVISDKIMKFPSSSTGFLFSSVRTFRVQEGRKDVMLYTKAPEIRRFHELSISARNLVSSNSVKLDEMQVSSL